ncbi:MAG: isoleucine--tRNA ligase [Nocardioidaceae bacterium]|nr:isoleucine--tRNA ligase [Nocardioidaceae bacterium]
MSAPYRAVPTQIDLPALEREILTWWDEHDTFARSLAETADAPRWTFYEGPPTANGKPGTHHVEARVFKDVFPRFKTMQGFHVERKAGWDCQGLHVEVGVEKELGVSGKQQIEAYGIAEFNAKCRESVQRSTHQFEEMTERMGYWVDTAQAYRTMDPSYIESVWWSLKQIYDKDLLFEAKRVSPYCPRCETALSDHELGQPGGYETVVDPSVYVRFPITSGPFAGAASLLVWTTTPWTLVSNTAVAVHPDVDYVAATDGSETLVVAQPLFESVLGDSWTVTSTVSGRAMEYWAYQRPFDLVTFPAPAHFVVLAEYVTTEDGSGLVHQSPAFGADDLEVCASYGLPVVNPITPDGHFATELPLIGGQFFKHADADLVSDLDKRGLLFRHVAYEHSYPHCWRCHTPLMYYALPAWYIRTTAIKEGLIAENEKTNWHPENVKHGRFGNWLDNNVDWSLSRTRYWGTPLPIWRCADNNHLVCVGSLAELGELAGQDVSALDPHRPYVDDVSWPCLDCGQGMRRVTEVIDAWYDSGSMPFAQWGYPYADGSTEEFDNAYPAQFICEAIDQTRGWFYSLMAIGTLVFGKSSYENVVCLGLLLAEDGRKMSKHLGNILEPMPLMDTHGADAVRWFMTASGSPWAARRIGPDTLQEIVRKVLLTYWNTVAFHTLYARTASWVPYVTPVPELDQRPVLDRWALSQAHRLAVDVTAAMEKFDTQRAGALLAAYIDDLSNWYVRRSRRRFWDGDPAALATLHECLYVVTLLMAPITPFVTERVWQDVFRATSTELPESVHLARWPRIDGSLVDEELDLQVRLARRLVELGRSARAEAKVRTRQPLQRALIGSAAFERLSDELLAEVAGELNVQRVESFASAGDLVEHTVKANFRTLGKRFGKETPAVASVIAAADATRVADDLATQGATTVSFEGRPIQLSPDEVIVAERPAQGWSVINEHGETVALDLEMTPELRRAGLAREVIRLVQDARKSSGFDVSDRIRLTWSAESETAAAIREHADMIAGEVLAVRLEEADSQDECAEGAGPWARDAELGVSFAVSVAR